MTSPSAGALLDDPLAAARKAEERLWDPHSDNGAARLRERNTAVHCAVAAGYSTDDVARALSLRPSDVERILSQ